MPERTTQYLPLDDLRGDPRNPKAHDLAVIDESVGRFGVIDLIVRDDRTGFIVSGHGRTAALRAMRDRGESAPDGVIVEGEAWLVPVTVGWSSRSDQEASAALIALNRTTELGGWVDDALLDLLDDLSETEDGLVGVGYGEKDLDALRARLDAASDAAYDKSLGGGMVEDEEQSRDVEVRFMMSPEQRTALNKRLRAHKKKEGLEGDSVDVLLHALGVRA